MRGRLTALPVPDQQRLGLGLTGALSLASAGVSSLFIGEHASLCGVGSTAHCGWCLAAAGFAVLGAVSLAAAALSDRPAL